MNSPVLTNSEIAVSLPQLFPPAVRAAVISDRQFRDKYDLTSDAEIKFEPSGLTFTRSKLFDAIRNLLGEPSLRSVPVEGTEWKVELDLTGDERKIVLASEQRKTGLPDFTCLSPNSAERIAWFNTKVKKFNLNAADLDGWRRELASGPVRDEDVDNLLAEFRLTPAHVASAISKELQTGTIRIAVLIPNSMRYYERLIGPSNDAKSLLDFIESSRQRMQELVERKSLDGMQLALLTSAHSLFSSQISAQLSDRDVLLRLLEWLESDGDRLSQLAGIEIGFAMVERYPEIEPILLRLIQPMLKDDPADKEGRLELLSSLIVLVDGELAQTGVLRSKPVYWRRLAAIAQASLIERQAIEVGVPPTTFSNWVRQGRNQLFYLRSLADLRTEPRWLPDFIASKQMKAELLGRIAGAANKAKEEIQSSELRSVLFDDGPAGLQAQLEFPFPYLAGPLEGGVEAINEMPPEIEAQVRSDLEAETLTAKSFTGLVNCALLFRLGPSVAALAAQALRRVKHQLRDVAAQEEIFALLSGLAIVAAVTRSTDLADDVRILARVMRRRAGIKFEVRDITRIGLVAAASHGDIDKWLGYVGDWLTELAFEDIGRTGAMVLREYIHELCIMEPLLWESCARAEAACVALAAT